MEGTTLKKCGTIPSVHHTPSSQVQGIQFPLMSFHLMASGNAFLE
jgi:hypothetical protein